MNDNVNDSCSEEEEEENETLIHHRPSSSARQQKQQKRPCLLFDSDSDLDFDDDSCDISTQQQPESSLSRLVIDDDDDDLVDTDDDDEDFKQENNNNDTSKGKEKDGLTFHSAIMSALILQPEERWYSSKSRTTTSPSLCMDSIVENELQLISFPDACLLRTASYLDPHEIHNFFSASLNLHNVTIRNVQAFQKLQISSVITYFSILKCYADLVETNVEGGWKSLILFLAKVSQLLQCLYGDVRVPKLHRALLGEKILGNLVGTPMLPWKPTTIINTHAGEEKKKKQRPSLARCIGGDTVASLACHVKYQDNILLGDINTSFLGSPYEQSWKTKMNTYLAQTKSQVPSSSSSSSTKKYELDQDGKHRLQKGLVPIIWLWETNNERHGYTVQLGINVPSSPCCRLGSMVYLYSVDGWDDTDDTDASWIEFGPDENNTSSNADYCWRNPISSLSAFYCLVPSSYSASFVHGKFVPLINDECHAFASCVAHGIAPFDNLENGRYWEDKIMAIKRQEEEEEEENRMDCIETETVHFALAALKGELPLANASDYV